MLKKLRIDNFALIDQAIINFDTGFTVITGETGSGKSILLNALNLILGDRANFGVIGSLKDKSVVEAEIDISGFSLNAFFDLHELDYDDHTIVRREIYQQGRSRAFINDIPVQLATLKDFSSRLIHIHSQYNTLELKDVSFQMEVLDILSGTLGIRDKYAQSFLTYQEQVKKLQDLEERLRSDSAQLDYNSFQLEELRELNLSEVDYESLSDEQKIAENSDELKIALGEVVSVLSQEEGIIELLTKLNSSLAKGEQYGKSIVDLRARINSVRIELQDIANEAENHLESVEVDPARLLQLSLKVDLFNKILHKHRVGTQEELKAIEEELSEATKNTSELGQEIEALKISLAKNRISLEELADDLHESRLKAIPSIESTIKSSLAELKLPDTQLIFSLTKSNDLNKTGNSKLEMLFSPNRGFEPVLIHQAASGGELSRLMLSLQNLVSKKTKLQTIFFDEIDTGVSGDVAQKIGDTLRKMGDSMQVIAITHLPQVAAKGGQHLCVTKGVVGETTLSHVKELSIEERIEEIARLMSGDKINKAAISNAKALMS